MAKKNQNKETVSTASKEVVDTTTNQQNITADNAPGNETPEIENENSTASKESKEDKTNESDSLKENDSKEYFEDENGQKYGFTKRTPEKFRFNGVIKTQAEWLQDEDAMEMLIYGNSMYIKQLN